MKICTNVIESFSTELLTTEIRFYIASARATECDLICLKSKTPISAEDKEMASVLKNLRLLKKEGRIDFFADKSSFDTGSAEARYLKNKFPESSAYINEDGFLFIIKL